MQLSLFSFGAANNANLICMSAAGEALLAGGVPVADEAVSFAGGVFVWVLHHKPKVITVKHKKITFIIELLDGSGDKKMQKNKL